MMDTAFWYAVGVLAFIFAFFKLERNMIDITALQAEVKKEASKDAYEKAKKQLIAAERDIANAEQVLANLKRKRDDLLIAISDGTN